MSEGGNVVVLEQVLGKRLQSARQAAGLTQQGLCHLANLSYSTLAKIERGAIKAPSIFTIQAIATALNVSLDSLVYAVSSPVGNSRQLKTTKSGVKFIYFDVNGCLVRFYQRAFNKIAQDYELPLDLVEGMIWKYNDQVCRGELSLNEFNRLLASRFKVKSINWQDYYLAAVEPIEAMQELLLWAKDFYYVGLMTNTMPSLISNMITKGVLPNIHYDSLIDSSEVGAIKPNQQIYDIATKATSVKSSEILLIDDTQANLYAADLYGWKGLWFDYARPEESAKNIRQALEPIN